MVQRKLPLLTILILFFIYPGVVSANDENSKENQHAECGIYLAESTIPKAGLGMFAGNRDYEEDDIVTNGDLMVPLFEMDWHNGHLAINFLWDEYTWSASMFWGTEEEIDDQELISVASFGMGAAVNCMLPLVNVGDSGTYEDYYTDSIGLDNAGVLSHSPGIGAFTPYHGRSMEAQENIPAGQEFFVNYGEDYFQSREAYSFVSLGHHYKEADEIIEGFQNLTARLSGLSPSTKEDLWKVVSDPSFWNTRLFNALPDTLEDAVECMKNGGTGMQHYNASIRSLDWLEENGECMDNIKEGISTIPDAGRGAFARRFIQKGDVASPAPLIHLPSRHVLTLFDGKIVLDDDEEDYVIRRDASNPNHKQLLLNYCFGHRDSTLLLCPYGYLSSLINHSRKEPNAKIAWSRKEALTVHPEWFNQSIKDWGGINSAGLSFDFVALRDIEEDEEILIDYGPEWEEAWQDHVKNFQSPRPNYVPAFELNRMADLKVKTLSEYDYRSEGVIVYCRRFHVLHFGLDIAEADDWEGFEESPHLRLGIYPCQVVERHDDDSYTVELIDTKVFDEGDDLRLWPHHEVASHALFYVPRDIFYFRDAPMYRDHHQTWAFRHEMRIPDEMFPKVWKNLKKNEE